MNPTQATLDAMNAEFWNELCGTGLAKNLGLTDNSPESLRRFDEAYLNLYPYLLPIIQPQRMAGKDVLEIGLGYGTLGQQIAQAGARYTGLDLAPNAARMTDLRMKIQGFNGTARVGSALEMPFPDHSFDFVVSIGCFHHTGNVQRCFDETWRVLRPGGRAVLMVYNKYSFRQWSQWPFRTFKETLRGCGLLRSRQQLNEAQKFGYDHNHVGSAAPETVLLSKGDLRRMLARFEQITLQKQNSDPLHVLGRQVIARERLLSNLGRLMGLDIYIEAVKPLANSATERPGQTLPLAKAG